MKRFFISLFLLIAVSCGKNGLYIHMDNTMWEITNEEQSGWLSFPDEEHVSLLQINHEEKAYRTMNGTYTVDGHRVIMSMDDNVIKATRTFSHLKNSSNKNYRKPSPLAPKKLKGSLWVGLKERNLRFIYFSDDSVCKEGHFENVSHTFRPKDLDSIAMNSVSRSSGGSGSKYSSGFSMVVLSSPFILSV